MVVSKEEVVINISLWTVFFPIPYLLTANQLGTQLLTYFSHPLPIPSPSNSNCALSVITGVELLVVVVG